MKRVFSASLALFLLLPLALCGCGEGFRASYVSTLRNWMFQENSGTNEYNLFFSLHDKDGDTIDAGVTVDVRIEDASGNVLYEKTHTVTENDYGDFSNLNASYHLACVRIPKSSVKEGVSSSGKVYLKVYKEDVVAFDEVNCDALYCLPVKGIDLVCDDNLPIELKIKDYRGRVEGVIRVEEVKYAFDAGVSSNLEIELTGTKTQGGSKSFDYFIYKLYDSNGFMIDSGIVYLSSLSAGDKFKEDIRVYKDVTPGETYTIKFEEYSY